MKTKSFLLATSGATVDGRVIDDKMLTEMAEGYDPQTYGARCNIEHIRGISGEGPFRAYGDVLELSTGEVEVNFHGKTEKRLGLYGVFDVTEEAKRLNEAGQKMYSSIEIEPNFANKGKAYLMGVAFTDSPAAIATERLKFNRSLPGMISLSRDEAVSFELAEDRNEQQADGFISKFGDMLEKTFAKLGIVSGEPDATEQKGSGSPPEPKPSDAQTDFSQLKPLFEGLGQNFTQEIGTLRTEIRGEIDGLSVKIKKVEDTIETTSPRDYSRRPAADGGAVDNSAVF